MAKRRYHLRATVYDAPEAAHRDAARALFLDRLQAAVLANLDNLEHVFAIDLDESEPLDEEDDDPVCVCGTARSEHALCGCPEGFQTAAAWEREKAFIAGLSDDEFERIYGGDR